VRSLRDQWPIPDPATALRHSARYLDELIGSVVPEAMKPLSEGGWSGSEFELWHARLRRVRVCVPEEPLVFRSESQSQLQPQQVRNVTRREWNASETRSSLLNSELNLRRLRQDENYQNLVEHYRRGIRSGVVADVDWEAERQRPDATRDALIQAAVSTMVTQVRPWGFHQIPDDCFISQLVTVCPYIAQHGTDTSFLTLTGRERAPNRSAATAGAADASPDAHRRSRQRTARGKRSGTCCV
jgi:hypothetical protein